MNILTEPMNFPTEPKMPFLEDAFNPLIVERLFNQHLTDLHQGQGKIELESIRLIRHKIGKRCLIEYQIRIVFPYGEDQSMTLLGKIRAKGLDQSTYQLNQNLWQQGFNSESVDQIMIPQPIGVIPEFQMWLQRRVTGVNSTDLLTQETGIDLVSKIAVAIHKLHQVNIPLQKTHTMIDELSILHQRLGKMIDAYPYWQKRLERLLKLCDRLGENTKPLAVKGIHRDFYPDQILVNGENLYLLDLDLYCQGDIAVDVGNFMAHLTEQSLRCLENPDALTDQEIAFKDHYLKLVGKNDDQAIESSKILTLVRHISISEQISERQPFTSALIDLCEEYFHQAGYF
jgi:thiamine kinase-like enzyme